MSSAGSDARAVFWSLVDSLADESTHVDFNLGGQVVDRESPQSWGSDWTGLRLRLESPAGVAAPPGDEALPAAWAAKLFALVLALLSVAEIGSADEEFLGREEGMRQETTAASRTRSAANRLACLQLKGSRCLACGADLGHVYGAIGDGCIEVHHLERLADYSEPRRVNPATDLVPLCPNCHAIAHRASPPLGVDDLKRSLAEGSLLHAATPDGESEA
jgi:5-methylcytosine-specific restriction protein A